MPPHYVRMQVPEFLSLHERDGADHPPHHRGAEGFNYLEEYSAGATERGKALRKSICDKFGFASLEFQSLDGVVKSIGLPPEKLCTYCWNGKE